MSSAMPSVCQMHGGLAADLLSGGYGNLNGKIRAEGSVVLLPDRKGSGILSSHHDSGVPQMSKTAGRRVGEQWCSQNSHPQECG